MTLTRSTTMALKRLSLYMFIALGYLICLPHAMGSPVAFFRSSPDPEILKTDKELARKGRWDDWLSPIEPEFIDFPWELPMTPFFNNWRSRRGNSGGMRLWSPQVDIVEDEKQYLISAEVAGMKPGEMKVTTKNGLLTIEGEREVKKETGEGNFRRIERSHGKFRREIRLPENADINGVAAKYTHGVLEVTVPKTDHEQATEVKIQHEAIEPEPVKQAQQATQQTKQA